MKKVESHTNTLVIKWSAMKNFAERFKEHQKDPSPIYDPSIRSGHEINIDNFSKGGREDQTLLEP